MHGVVLGKFLPPHQGHLYLVEFAQCFADEVTVVVGSLPAEPIPGELRYQWMKQLFPQLHVVHLTDENPQYPHEHPDFWQIWRASLERVVAKPVDAVFASESYGAPLAAALSATFIPTNALRDTLPVSGTAIRQDPLAHWSYLPLQVKRYFQKRIVIFGPESSGKTTLAGDLARHFQGMVVAEYARTWLAGREDQFTLQDMEMIARGQRASELSLSSLGSPYLFCDTDALTTALWSRQLFDRVPDSVNALAEDNDSHFTLLLQPDLPWEEDPLRFTPHSRQEFFDECRRALEVRGRPYAVITGTGAARLDRAVQAVEALSFALPT